MRLVRFSINDMRRRPRPPEYLQELRGCAVRVTRGWWEFDRDLPCYRALVEKYGNYRATADDVARAELVKAEERAGRDVVTRKLWGILHRRIAMMVVVDPVRETAFLAEFNSRIPCGECRRSWNEILERHPPDLTDADAYLKWSIRAHNAVNKHLGKPEIPVAEAVAMWRPAPVAV